MSDFQLIKEDEHAFTVKHPSGKHFQVAKAGLDKKVIAKIKAMKPVKMSDGGVVSNPADPLNVNEVGNTPGYADTGYRSFTTPPKPGEPWQVGDGGYRPDPSVQASRAPASWIGDKAHAIGDAIHQGVSDATDAFKSIGSPIIDGVKDATTGLVSGVAGNPMPSAQAATLPDLPKAPGAAPSDSRTPAGTQTSNSQLGLTPPLDLGIDALTSQAKGAYGAAAKAKQDEANANVSAIQNYQKQQDILTQTHMQEMQGINSDLDQSRNNMMTGKIDPNRVWNKMDTGNKVLAGVSILMGSLAGGLTGKGGNVAMDVLQKTIDRDIDSQKMDMDKNRTAYAMNLDRYKDANAAYAQTKLDLLNAAKTQMDLNAARSGGAQAAAGAQLAGVQFDQAMMPYKQEMLKYRVAQGLQSNPDPAAKSALIRYVVPEKQQEQAFKELQAAENHAKQSSTIMSAFDQVNGDNTLGNRAVHGGFEPASIARIKTALLPYLKDAEGRINHDELDRTDSLIPSVGDSPAKIEQKRLGLKQFIDEKASFPLLRAYGIKVPELYNSSGAPSIKESAPVAGK